MTWKYEPLKRFLLEKLPSREEISLSVDQIESIIGAPLPKSAHTHREWWANQTDVSTRPQARAWIEGGYKVDSASGKSTIGVIRFIRIGKDLRSAHRLPAKDLNRVTAENVWNAVEKLRSGVEHRFGPSTDFDVIIDTGERLPPKAVFGLAASEALGFEVQPKHFSGGRGTLCFRVLEAAGYPIVPKGEVFTLSPLPISDEDREWIEGKPRLAAHLRKERASGLAQAKKDNFVRLHGHLTCERCGMDPIQVYGGVHGLACIEVHHDSIGIEDMAEAHRTRLEDLRCLCANCHRVVHRLLKTELADEEAITNPNVRQSHADGPRDPQDGR